MGTREFDRGTPVTAAGRPRVGERRKRQFLQVGEPAQRTGSGMLPKTGTVVLRRCNGDSKKI